MQGGRTAAWDMRFNSYVNSCMFSHMQPGDQQELVRFEVTSRRSSSDELRRLIAVDNEEAVGAGD